MSAVDEIKSRIDIIDIVSETVKLRHSGKNFTGFCPFHPNTRTPAFVVFPETGTWRCFSCNEGGDVFSFLMKKEGWDFQQTLEYLANRTGVVLEAQTPEKIKEDEKLEKLRTILEESVTFFQHNLLNTEMGREAKVYVEKRGLTLDTIRTFGLGYSPNSWDVTHKYFQEKGYSEEELLRAGLAGERNNGGIYDRFRNRLMFPIRDESGRMAGFGARALSSEDNPKYLNSPQNELFDKSRLLYGLDLARKSIRKENQVVIVEGYMDVIGLYQGGFTNSVSPMGTAMNENQFRSLKRFTRQFVLALDPDAAGEKATLRGLDTARQSLDRSADFTPAEDGLFDARGLVRSEGRLQADLRVTTLPDGMDPDEVVLNNPQDWVDILASAKPIVEHVMTVVTAGQNLEDPKIKRDIANQILPLIEDVPNAVERDAYRQKLARLLRIDERALLTPFTTSRRKPKQQFVQPRETVQKAEAQQAQVRYGRTYELEVHCLKTMFKYPDAIYNVDRALQKAGLRRLDLQDFESSIHQQIIRVFMESLEQEDMEPQAYIRENLEEALLQPFENQEGFSEEKIPRRVQVEDLIKTLLHLRRQRISENLDQLRNFQQDMQDNVPFDFESYQKMIIDCSLVRQKLDKALNQPIQLD